MSKCKNCGYKKKAKKLENENERLLSVIREAVETSSYAGDVICRKCKLEDMCDAVEYCSFKLKVD